MNPLPAAGSQTAPGWADKPARWNGKGQPRMGFFTDTSICIGCKACEVACKEWNQVPEDGLDFLAMSYDNTGALGASTWRHVAFIEQRSSEANGEPGIRWLMSSDVCKHCTSAACLEVCPTGALIRTEFGTVVVQEDVCNGCGYCVPACPKACPTDSIQFGPLDELRGRADRRVRALHESGQTDARLYGADPADGVGGMGAFFLLLDDPEVYGLPPAPVSATRDLPDMWTATAAAALALAGVVAAAFFRRRP